MPRHVNISGLILVFSLKEFVTMQVTMDGRKTLKRSCSNEVKRAEISDKKCHFLKDLRSNLDNNIC